MTRGPHAPASDASSPPPPRVAWWNDRRGRAILYQIAVVAGVVLLAAYLIANTLANLETRNIATGFGFGFVSWVGIKALAGRFKDLNLVMVCIALCFVINFALRLP